jgi:pyrrolidone-carboxylate peptidase
MAGTMNQIDSRASGDRRPGIIICAYDGDDDGWDLVEDLSGEIWSPSGVRAVPIAAADPDELASTLAARLGSGECRAVLLVGRTQKGAGFRVQMRAENRTLDYKHRLSSTGPGVARTTAPVADMVRALTAAGLQADASSDIEEDAGSYLLYRVLSDLPDGPLTPSIGLLRAPAPANEAAVRKGVKAAASAMASHLTPLPRVG